MPKLTIDGIEYEAAAGKTVIQVALENGVEIPHFCWHPALTVAGNCRMCLVEIEKQPKLAIACSTQVAEGMVVKTLSDNAVKGREDVMEFLLVNHPLDCPICDEAGQCKLQDYAFSHSRAESRFTEEKNHKDKRTPFGPNVLFDAERCISCSRCIRFSSEIAQQPVLTFVDRGDHVTIEATPNEGFDNNYSMNVIDICPVGALTSRDFRFKARVWDMSFTDSVCPGCARGCDIRVGVRNNEILRLEPRPNPNVNDYWMCDHGRLTAYPEVNSPDRIEGCHVRENGSMVVVDWQEAIHRTSDALKKYRQEEVLFIGSARVPIEDNYLLAKLARAKFGKKEIPFVPHFAGEDERLLLRADHTPNALGVTLAGVIADEHYAHAVGEKHAHATILEQLRSGKIKAVFALEDDILADSELLRAFKGVEFFACLASNDTATSRRADVIFGASTWAEREGTFVQFNGWVQKLRPALATKHMVRGLDHMRMSRLDRFGAPNDSWSGGNRRDVKESWRVVQAIAKELGVHWHYNHTEDVFVELAGVIPEFKGMDYDTIGDVGLPLAGGDRVVKPALYEEVYQVDSLHEVSVGSVML
jgi:NADH-quinone oxidoreductase subunit G